LTNLGILIWEFTKKIVRKFSNRSKIREREREREVKIDKSRRLGGEKVKKKKDKQGTLAKSSDVASVAPPGPWICQRNAVLVHNHYPY
jgi:hypothetical protein